MQSRNRTIYNMAMNFPYDMVLLSRDPISMLEKMLRAITLFNEHDWPGKGCFKKSDECHFSYPRSIKEDFGLKFNWKSEPTTWCTA